MIRANRFARIALRIARATKVRRGYNRSFEPRERKTSCTGATWDCTSAKQGRTWCKRFLGDLCALGAKDLLDPLLTTFGDFPIFDPSPRCSGLQHSLPLKRQILRICHVPEKIVQNLCVGRPERWAKDVRGASKNGQRLCEICSGAKKEPKAKKSHEQRQIIF